MQSPFELLVFDFDGTLVDSQARIVSAMQTAFEAHGLAVPAKGSIREIIGLHLLTAIARLGSGLNERACLSLADAYKSAYAAATAVPTPLFDRVEETLRLLGQTHLLTIATSKSRAGLNSALVNLGIAEHFIDSVTVDECAPKPDPEMLRCLFERYAVDPRHTLMIGDTTYDLEMAHAAGTSAAAVAFGAHERQVLLDCQPLFVVDDFGDLPRYLQRLTARSP